MVDEKHYVPTLEDFIIGTIYKEKSVHDQWMTNVFDANKLRITGCISPIALIDMSLRRRNELVPEYIIPYLDTEDFEALGFKEVKSEKEDWSKFNKVNCNIEYSSKTKKLIISINVGETPTIVFRGNVLNRGELEKLLQQVGIIKTPARLKKLKRNEQED